MKQSKTSAFFLGLAALIIVSAPAAAAPADARAAQARVQWALDRLDELMSERRQLDAEAGDLDSLRRRVEAIRFRIGNTASNYDRLCTMQGGTPVNCPNWLAEINQGNAEIERLRPDYERRSDALRMRMDQHRDRIERMRIELDNRVNDLASACRGMAAAEWQGLCFVPGGGRFNGRFVDEARAQLQSSL